MNDGSVDGSAGGVSRRPRAHVSHLIPGRARLRIPERRRDDVYFSTLKQRVSEWPGITHVQVNPLTASILVFFSDAAAALAHAQGCDMFELVEADAPQSKAPIGDRARHQVRAFDARVRELTGGMADTQSLVFVALSVAGLYQALRGSIGVPAFTLLWYAGDTLRLWNGAPERLGMRPEREGKPGEPAGS